MPTLDVFLQVFGGAAGTGAIAGLWLYVTLKENKELKAEVKALNAKIEARDALRLAETKDVFVPLTSNTAAALRGLQEAIEADHDEPAGPGTRREPTGGHRRQRP